MASIHSKYACTRTPPPPKTSSLQHKINQRLGVYQELELGLVVEFLPTVWAQGPEFVTKHPKTTSFSNKLKYTNKTTMEKDLQTLKKQY